MLSMPDGFMFYEKRGIDFSFTSQLLYPSMKVRLQLLRAKPRFRKINENPSVSLAIVHSPLYTRRIALKDDYHRKRLEMFTYTPVEIIFLVNPAKSSVIPAGQNQITRENFQNNAPVRRTAHAMKKNSVFSLLYTENPFWYLTFTFREIGKLGGGQPAVDFDAADNCC